MSSFHLFCADCIGNEKNCLYPHAVDFGGGTRIPDAHESARKVQIRFFMFGPVFSGSIYYGHFAGAITKGLGVSPAMWPGRGFSGERGKRRGDICL